MVEITLWGEGAGCFKSFLRRGSKSQRSVWCYQIFLPGLKTSKERPSSRERAGDELLRAAVGKLGLVVALRDAGLWGFAHAAPALFSKHHPRLPMVLPVRRGASAPAGEGGRAASGRGFGDPGCNQERCPWRGQPRGMRGPLPAGGQPAAAAAAGRPGESGHRFGGGGCPGAGGGVERGGRGGGRGNEPPAAVTEALTFTPAPATAPFRAS